MSLATAEQPRIVHALPGRVRVHLPGWEGRSQHALETALRRMRGVSDVRSSPLTRNVLIRFDPEATDDESILLALRELEWGGEDEEVEEEPEAPPTQRERHGPAGRARIAVRGMDRDPELARRVVERLESRPSVKASASQLTGRVRVEFDKRKVGLEEVLSMVSGLELPELPGEDRPTHPLDREPLFEGTIGTVGAFLGLGLHAGRRLLGLTQPLVDPTIPVTAAGMIGLLEGFPVTRGLLHRLLGERVVRLLTGASTVVLHTLSGSTLGLAVAGAGAFQLFTEVRARRERWRSYDERVEATAPAPGAFVTLDAGEPAPLAATIVEGTGTAIMRDGLPSPAFPGATVDAGTRLHGGPFRLELRAHEPFIPESRPSPESEPLHGRYARTMVPVTLSYAAATALLTQSLSRTFAALLLVNPRTAEIGRQFADTGASARVLRSGVTVVGTRPDRVVRRLEILLLDGSRVLTDGLEVNDVLPQTEAMEPTEILALASQIAAAAGSPWGRAFPVAGDVSAADGTFDGETATAEIGRVRYFLGPIVDPSPIPAVARFEKHGSYLLGLRREGRLLGILALQPRLAGGVVELVETCGRRGVEITLLDSGTPTARAVAERAGVTFLVSDDAVQTVRDLQADGQTVALVSDSAHAAEGFAACDLAIGLTSGRSSNFPARADLLAPDLGAIAAIAETGTRREAVVRDSIMLSIVANVLGAVWGFRGAPRVERASHAVYVTALAAMVDGWARLGVPRRPRESSSP
jgi:cation-transporting ATPase I